MRKIAGIRLRRTVASKALHVAIVAYIWGLSDINRTRSIVWPNELARGQRELDAYIASTERPLVIGANYVARLLYVTFNIGSHAGYTGKSHRP